MTIINTNIAALSAQRHLNSTTVQLATAMQRLSSGLRVNSAKDDAAGQSIASRMSTQVRGLDQGIRNVADGVSLAQTAEGGLESIVGNLQRIRELAVQAANFTNTATDRSSLQLEVAQLREEITRVANQTSFNGVRLLDGSLSSAMFQAGANVGETINIASIPDARAENIGSSAQTLTTTQAIIADTGWDNFSPITVAIAGGPAILLGSMPKDAGQLAAAINAVGIPGLSATADPNVITGAPAVNGSSGQTFIFNIGFWSVGITTTGDANQDRAQMATNINGVAGLTGISAVDLGPGQGLQLISAAGNTIYIDGDSTGASWVGLGGLPRNDGSAYGGRVNISYQVPEMTLGNLVFTNTGMATESFALPGWSRIAKVDLSTVPGANVAIAAVDAALQSLSGARAKVGAAMNRFEAAIGALRITREGQVASRSRIEDADFAVETAALARTQILQKSGMAILAQANAVPRNVLALLR